MRATCDGGAVYVEVGGKPVSGAGEVAAGEWRRLGPWAAEASGGAVEVVVAGGRVAVCGIEAWAD